MGGVIAPLMFSVKHNFESDGWTGNFCLLCNMFLFAICFILCQKFTSFLAFNTNFPFVQDFQIFMTVVNFKEKYFQFKKETISNFWIC